MPAGNAKVADLLRRYASTVALQGADRFKVKAYQRAAETIEMLHEDVANLVARREDLRTLPGVGSAISGVIEEIVKTGTLAKLDQLVANLQPEVAELATHPRLDPKKVLRVYKKLKIGSLKELAERLASGEIRSALGDRIEYHVRQGLDTRPRMLLRKAEKIAPAIEAFLSSLPGVEAISRTGSLRRKKDTVGDLSFLVSGPKPAALFKRFASFGGVLSSERSSKERTVYQLSSGMNVSLASTSPAQWGLALVMHTGSAAHLEGLHARARKQRLPLSAQALHGKGVDLSDERAIYTSIGLPFIEPELREGRGEVEAAASGKLPALVSLESLQGDLHMHTTESDGANSLSEMADAARTHGYRYIAITDHSQSLKLTNGLSEKRLLQQIKNIDKLNSRLKDLVVLKSAEVDILQDGSLDYSNAVLKELDCTICSIHSLFRLNREQQTERILRAMDNRYFNILGHATGRLLLQREGYEIDVERIIEHAKANGCYFEINSSPNRLDLSDEHAKLAKDGGVKIAINTDAHSIAELDFMGCGINQARRAWLEPHDILNAQPLAALKKLLRR